MKVMKTLFDHFGMRELVLFVLEGDDSLRRMVVHCSGEDMTFDEQLRLANLLAWAADEGEEYSRRCGQSP